MTTRISTRTTTRIEADQLADLSSGAVLLATGGGGDPYVSYLSARQTLTAMGPVTLLKPEALTDDAYVVAIGGVGAPSVGLELLPSSDEPARALAAFEAHVGRKIDALVSFEVGGGNSMIPLIAGASSGLPVIDGDGMGRALPEAQMMTFPIAGVAPTPALALDYAGNTATFSTDSTATYERHVRAMAQAMGGMILTVEHPMTGAELKRSVVPETISFSIELGRVLRERRGNAEALIAPLRAAFADSIYGELRHLYTGKIADSASQVIGGYDVGRVRIESFDEAQPDLLIDIRNEYLVARLAADSEDEGRVVSSVPDLISLLDLETGAPINSERVRFGQRVAVIAIGCPDFYREPRALAVVAPRCFGFDFDYVPLEALPAP
ncbi:MAG: DUF917 domain-containing protein [Pseudomonadota bacterium]